MTSEELTILKQMGVSGVIRKYLPRLQHGEITKTQYDALIKLVTPVFARKEAGVPKGTFTQDANTGTSGASRAEDQDHERPDRQDHAYVAPQNPLGVFAGTHPDQKAGSSQKAKILALLQDHEFHTTVEIMNRVYRVGEDRGNCNIKARINELRNELGKEAIETKRITKTLYAYRLV